MSTKKLLNRLVELRDDLTAYPPGAQWEGQRRGMVQILRSYRGEIEYEKARENGSPRIDFYEGGTPLTKKDRENIEAAAAVNRQIGKQLGQLKRARK